MTCALSGIYLICPYPCSHNATTRATHATCSMREVTTMTRLPEHPNVLRLLGVCTVPPNLALVTQCVPYAAQCTPCSRDRAQRHSLIIHTALTPPQPLSQHCPSSTHNTHAHAPTHLCRFCERGSLYGLLHSPGCYLSWAEVVAMLLGAARGMVHLHANSVLHRCGGVWGVCLIGRDHTFFPLPSHTWSHPVGKARP